MSTPFLLFNDVGGSEVVLIFLIVLIFFGPKSIPSIAKTIGRAIYSIRNASDELKDEIKKAGVDVKKDLNLSSFLKEEEQAILEPLDQTLSGIDNTVHFGRGSGDKSNNAPTPGDGDNQKSAVTPQLPSKKPSENAHES